MTPPLLRASRVEAELVRYEWDWAAENRDFVAENWDLRRDATPAIFNGRVLMVSDLEIGGDAVRAAFFATDYANLVAWIDAGFPDGRFANGFAMGALRSADGAFLLGRMADGTANAGKLYFPCGTPDMSDVTPDGAVDLAGSLVREIGEETGLSENELAVDPDWLVIRDAGLVAFMRIVNLAIDAETARDRILAHLAADPNPELSDIRIARSPGDIDPDRMPGVVPIFLRHAFAAATAQR